MEQSSKILVTGGSGLIGTNLVAELVKQGFSVTAPTHSEYDLENRGATMDMFAELRPDYVFHLAAKTGGIQANIKDPVHFLYANILISGHVLEACHKFKVKKTVQLASACMYPKDCQQPMKEEYLLKGSLEPTNEGYALAKITAMKLGKYYHDQYGVKIVCPLASNVYGPGDTFDLDRAHVISALVKRFSDAKAQNLPALQLWGTGAAQRQFVHVRDVVRALIYFMNSVESAEPINLGPLETTSIRELAEIIAKAVGYTGKIEWDSTKSDGMLLKSLDVSKIHQLGFKTEVSLRDGILDVIRDYSNRG